MNQAENSWWRNQSENQSNLWKVFEFAINILQALGEEARPLGLTTKARACCGPEKWFSESTQLKRKNYSLNSMWGMQFIRTRAVFESPTRRPSSEELAPGFQRVCLSGALTFHCWQQVPHQTKKGYFF